MGSPSPRKFAASSVAIEIKLCANLWGAGVRGFDVHTEVSSPGIAGVAEQTFACREAPLPQPHEIIELFRNL